LNEDLIRMLYIPEEGSDPVAQRQLKELQRKERLYRGSRPQPDVRDRTILIDGGLATGTRMRAAIARLSAQHPARIVVAVPTVAPETCEALKSKVNEVICAITPKPFLGVGQWYEDFSQTTDDGVRLFLEDIHQQLVTG
jgi:putative phosphoribosyl transferase